MLQNKRNLVLAGAVAIALCLTGCGNRMPANAPIDDASSTGTSATSPAPAASAALPAPVTPAAPVAAYVQPVTGSLVVSNVEKTKSGFILKTMTVTGSVINSSNVALSGTLKIQFKKTKGIFSKTVVVTDTKTQVVTLLQPGQSFPFTVKASNHGDDDAEVTVDTNPAAAAAPATGAPVGAPAATTGGTGASAMGYGYPAATGAPY
jgi:hypothetical protein